MAAIVRYGGPQVTPTRIQWWENDLDQELGIRSSVAAYNRVPWKFIAFDESAGKLVLSANIDHLEKVIRIDVFLSDQYNDANRYNEAMEQFLNTWIYLPCWGQNSVMLVRRPSNGPTGLPKIMFPKLEGLGLELRFRSGSGQCEIQIEFFDVIQLCNGEQLWPICAWCGKYLAPPEDHRGSRTHRKALGYYESSGRDWMLKCLGHVARWL